MTACTIFERIAYNVNFRQTADLHSLLIVRHLSALHYFYLRKMNFVRFLEDF